MKIEKFIGNFKNYPVLFIGTGMSLRYLKHSYTWDGLLNQIALDLTDSNEYYLDLKAHHYFEGNYDYEKIASDLEKKFNETVQNNRNGKFKTINDQFYENMKYGKNISRFKLYLCSLFKNIEFKEEKIDEINEFKKVRKNVGSVITTNYDQLIENLFEFSPLIGNDILLSNPYGSVYKIHGCFTTPDKIIITHEDYVKFEKKYELIRAQLLSIFIHNPIIFMGYSITDNNIRKILKTIFEYVPLGSELGEKIKANFLLVEYEENSNSTEVYEHDIFLDENTMIRVNKIKTDNFLSIYKSLSTLQLPVSAMDIRKVQNVVKEIYEGGSIQVKITEDIDSLANDDKVVAIGTQKTIKYEYQTTAEMMINYFTIIEEENFQLLALIDKQVIQKNQYFPIFAFSLINKNISKSNELKSIQIEKIKDFIKNTNKYPLKQHNTINEILDDSDISKTNKANFICLSILDDSINIEDAKEFLINFQSKKTTPYRKILCIYDFKKYATEEEQLPIKRLMETK